MDIKGAIFDCDGTLIDSLGFWELFYPKVGERYLGGKAFFPDPADDRAMRTQNVLFLGNLLHEKYGIAQSAEEIVDWCLEIFTWYYTEVVQLKPGVRELLAHLKQKGVKMCVASAAEKKMVQLVLGHHGILDYFEGIISCTEVGAGKDKPDVFLAAADFLGTKRVQTFVFEDSVLAMETAGSVGFPVVGIYDPRSFGQDKARTLCSEYIEQDGSFAALIPKIQ